jgi:RimJ/RimL family protein N-acetyltransferase
MSQAQSGKALLAALKETAGGDGPPITIPVGRPPAALLRPVATRPDRINPADVRCLTEWRNRFLSAFLTEFPANDARTTRWLTDIVGPHPGKILFMVEDPGGRCFAYMGLDLIDWERGYGEADAIVRGGDAPKGVMTAALQTLLAWAQSALGLSEVGVRVRSNNSAVQFYEKCGFVEHKRVPLRRVDEPGMVRYVEDPSAKESHGYSLVYMDYCGPGKS